MLLSAEKFVRQIPPGSSVSVVVGRNGAGKSRFLLEVAKYLIRQERTVITISNTPYDKLSRQRHTLKISASAGRLLPRSLIVKAISTASEVGPDRIRTIADVLQYCGYDPKFTLTMKSGPIFRDKIVRRSDLSDEVALVQAIRNVPLLAKIMDTKLPRDLISRDVLEAFRLAHDLVGSGEKSASREFDLRNSEIEASVNFDFASVLRHEDVLRRYQAIGATVVTLWKNKIPVDLEKASSGELSLISALAFLATALKKRAYILIDEPENSLHPQWQRDYLKRLLDLLYLYEPTIVAATHAPLIVTGALLEESVGVGIYEAKENGVEAIGEPTAGIDRRSVEETLWETFKTITPKSHFVSESLSDELEKLAHKETNLQSFDALVDSMHANSFDEKQKKFLSSVKELARKVDAGDVSEGEVGDA